jgi:pyruvate dehydrogenase E1 component beta subunit
MEQAFDYLDAPVKRVVGADAPMPYAESLVKLTVPQTEWVIDAVRQVCYRG